MKNSNHYSRVNFNIAITGVLLGLALLFQYLSGFMHIAPVMTINLSLAFIVPIFFVANYKFGMIAIISKFVIGIFMEPGAFGGIVGEAVGQLILLFAGLIYIHTVLLFKKIKLWNKKFPMLLGVITATIISTLLMTLLNGIIFVPMYNYVLGYGFTQSVAGAPWGIDAYWDIIFAIFIVGNLVNYSITSMLLIPVMKIIRPKLNNSKLAN